MLEEKSGNYEVISWDWPVDFLLEKWGNTYT